MSSQQDLLDMQFSERDPVAGIKLAAIQYIEGSVWLGVSSVTVGPVVQMFQYDSVCVSVFVSVDKCPSLKAACFSVFPWQLGCCCIISDEQLITMVVDTCS